MKLPPTVNLLQDKGKLMDFLLRRRECKMVILSVCSQSAYLTAARLYSDQKSKLMMRRRSGYEENQSDSPEDPAAPLGRRFCFDAP